MSTDTADTGSRPSSAVVLAAGEGTRLRPLTANRPKPMLPAGTRPILEHVLNGLIDAEVNDIHLVVGYRASRVRSHFGSIYRDVPLTYHTQANQLGSGHALLQARDGPNGPFLLVNGDQIVDRRIVKSVRTAHTNTAATLAVVEGPEAVNYGAVHVDGDEVTELIEQPESGGFRLFNAGVYAFSQQLFETLDTLSVERGELPLTAAIQQLIDEEEDVTAVRTDHFWMDATHPWDLLSVSRELLTRGWVDAPAIDTDIYVDDSAYVHPEATLVEPVVIDSDAVIEAGAVVGPYAAIGASATVGSGSVCSDIVVDTDTTIGPNTTAIELVAGQGCEIGAGLTAAGGPADVALDERIHSDINLGGVIADRVEICGGATLEPGALIGPGATIGDGVVVDGYIHGGSEVVR